MSEPVVKTLRLPAPKPFILEGSPMQVGSQLAEQTLRPALRATLDAMPQQHHESLLAGVLAELAAAMGTKLGRARTKVLLMQFAVMVERMPDDVANTLPPDPEVH